MNGRIYFAASNGVSGTELWSTDGTSEGTRLVADINAGSSDPDELTVLNNQIIFRAFTPATGTELWRSDGTAIGTFSIADIEPGAATGNPRRLTAAGGLVYFTAFRTDLGGELWRSDGTGQSCPLPCRPRTHSVLWNRRSKHLVLAAR